MAAATTNYPFLDDVYVLLNSTLNSLSEGIERIPGSHVVIWYCKSSYQNDPVRSLVEFLLLLFAIRYVLSPRRSSQRNVVQFTEKEVDELVAEWQPDPMSEPLTEREDRLLDAVPVVMGPSSPKCRLQNGQQVLNVASLNYLNLLHNETLVDKALETIQNYGVGACGPPGFYGSQDVHMRLESDIAAFLGVPSTILYAQAFQVISSVIPAFAKRGDYLVIDEACNFAIQKGVVLSRSNIRYFKHNDMDDLERICNEIHLDCKRSRRALTRRFIITEGLSSAFGDLAPLPRILEIKLKYKFRLILDETSSFSVIGKTGRGLTEYFDIDAKEIDMIVGSLATTYCAAGGFCAGSLEVVDHQRTTGMGYVFSASMAASQAVVAYEAMAMVCDLAAKGESPYLLLLENTSAFRAAMAKSEYFSTMADLASPLIPLQLSETALERLQSPSFETQDDILQDIVDDAQAHGVMVTRARHIPGQEVTPIQPSIRIAVTTGLNKRELERVASTLKNAANRVVKHRMKHL